MTTKVLSPSLFLRETTFDNNYLGEFDIDGIPPAPAGEAKFDVCIDANGILSVTGKDISTGREEGITINCVRIFFF